MIELPKPRPNEGETLLSVISVGIDGTDREINEGKYGSPPAGYDFLIIGHEALCVVEEVDGEAEVKKGDTVVPTVRRPDDCINCSAGEPDMCVKGEYLEHGIKGLHGFAADYAVSDVRFLVKIPSELEGVAVLLEPLSIAEKALEHVFKTRERVRWEHRRALVLGAGPLGLIATLLLCMRGLYVVTVATSPMTSFKVILTEEIGAEYVSSREREIGSLGGFDIIVEATGVAGLVLESLKVLRANGVLCLLGVYSESEEAKQVKLGLLLRDVVLGNKVIVSSVNSNVKHFQRGVNDMLK